MSELAREIIPIAVMYGFVLLLAPFIGVAIWIAYDGDRVTAPAEDAAFGTEQVTTEATQDSAQARQALGAA